jgi:hypothetical protein
MRPCSRNARRVARAQAPRARRATALAARPAEQATQRSAPCAPARSQSDRCPIVGGRNRRDRHVRHAGIVVLTTASSVVLATSQHTCSRGTTTRGAIQLAFASQAAVPR